MLSVAGAVDDKYAIIRTDSYDTLTLFIPLVY